MKCLWKCLCVCLRAVCVLGAELLLAGARWWWWWWGGCWWYVCRITIVIPPYPTHPRYVVWSRSWVRGGAIFSFCPWWLQTCLLALTLTPEGHFRGGRVTFTFAPMTHQALIVHPSAAHPKKIFKKRPTLCSFVRLNTNFHFSGRPWDWNSKLRLLRFRWPTFAAEFSKALLLIDCNRNEMTSRDDGLCTITRRTLMCFNKRPLSTPASPVHKRSLPYCISLHRMGPLTCGALPVQECKRFHFHLNILNRFGTHTVLFSLGFSSVGARNPGWKRSTHPSVALRAAECRAMFLLKCLPEISSAAERTNSGVLKATGLPKK